MRKTIKSQRFQGISPYIWALFSVLPFYFIFQSSSKIQIMIGILLTILFFIFLRLAFISTKWPVYLWTFLLISISVTMTILFNFIYFAFYIAYYNGNIKNRMAFFVLYVVHLVTTTFCINYNLVMQKPMFIEQIPFVLIIWISVILLPFNLYNKKKQGKLEEELEVANKRIAELVKQEERERIARDLHDTLGQKLSLIGLKSDLARKLIHKDPEQARHELKDVQQTARTALNEVRKMVSSMKGIRFKDELQHVRQLLDAANIEFITDPKRTGLTTTLFIENILSMCLKETVTNVVRHSGATTCTLEIEETSSEILLSVRDNGKGIGNDDNSYHGNGILGIKERLEFVNGEVEFITNEGTTVNMRVPKIVSRMEEDLL